MNRSAGYGMEVPCKYRLYGTRAYVERVQKIISHNVLHDYTRDYIVISDYMQHVRLSGCFCIV